MSKLKTLCAVATLSWATVASAQEKPYEVDVDTMRSIQQLINRAIGDDPKGPISEPISLIQIDPDGQNVTIVVSVNVLTPDGCWKRFDIKDTYYERGSNTAVVWCQAVGYSQDNRTVQIDQYVGETRFYNIDPHAECTDSVVVPDEAHDLLCHETLSP